MTKINLFDPFGMNKQHETKTTTTTVSKTAGASTTVGSKGGEVGLSIEVGQPKQATITKKATVTVSTPTEGTVTETSSPSLKVTVGPKGQNIETVGAEKTVSKTIKTTTTTGTKTASTAGTTDSKTITIDPVEVAKTVVKVDKSVSVSAPKTTSTSKTTTVKVSKESVELSAAEQQK